jgi:DnaJ like chaperone protein
LAQRPFSNKFLSSEVRRKFAMSIWEKLASAVSQSSIGASIGTLLGGVAHNHVPRDHGDAPADNEVPFTVGVIALSAKIAKADGVVTRDEVKAFKEAFKVPDGEMKHAARVFNLAKEEPTGYEAFAEELVTVFKGNRKLLEDVLEGLFHIAKADDISPTGRAVPEGGRQALWNNRQRVQLH